ncbi:MAG: hypothetical protein MHM6MM_002054 [Cercozoa sp. M6MM]
MQQARRTSIRSVWPQEKDAGDDSDIGAPVENTGMQRSSDEIDRSVSNSFKDLLNILRAEWNGAEMYRFGVVDLRWDWHALRAKCATCKQKRGAAGVVEDRLPTSASRFDGFDETLSNGAMCYCTLGHLLCTWCKLSAAELMGTLSGATSRQKRALTDDTADLLAAPDDLKFAVRALSHLFLILPTENQLGFYALVTFFNAWSLREQVQGFYSSSLAFFNKAESFLCEAGPSRKQRYVGANSQRCSGADNVESCFDWEFDDLARISFLSCVCSLPSVSFGRLLASSSRLRCLCPGSSRVASPRSVGVPSGRPGSFSELRLLILGTTFINSRN